MRRLVQFIKSFQVLLLFAVLQIILLTTYVTFNTFPRSQYLTTASNFSGKILSIRHDVVKHFQFSESNKALLRENARLRDQLAESKMITSGILSTDSTYAHADTLQHFEYIPATVINATHDKRNNYFTLNIGRSHGIRRGMGVISDKGIVGRIHNTSEHYSVVKSCLAQDINISVVMEKTGEPGILKWDGKNPRYANMRGVSNDTKIKQWSRIVTLGSAGIFPRGLPVGKVSETTVVEGYPLWDIKVLLSENLRAVQYVYVIKNIWLKEQQKLESAIPNE